MRKDRALDKLREIKITPSVNTWAEGSVRIEQGRTQVICTASVSESTPPWLVKPGQGWVTAEYAMLPRSSSSRIHRDRALNSGRSKEISRLIGRSLRSCINLNKLGERQITIDCDVIQADGGTRTTSITGGFVALALALKHLKDQSLIPDIPLKHYVSACSVGLKNEKLYLDLDYEEDRICDVDMNLVLNNQDQIIEAQGTAEKNPFTRKQFNEMIDLVFKASQTLFKKQEEIVGSFFPNQAGKS